MLDSLYLEQNVIGALLIQPECYEAAAELSPDDFLVPEYAELFRAIQRRNEAGDPADAPSVLMDASSRNDNVTSKIMMDCIQMAQTWARKRRGCFGCLTCPRRLSSFCGPWGPKWTAGYRYQYAGQGTNRTMWAISPASIVA